MTQQEAEVKLRVNSKEALDKINTLEKEAEKLRKKFNDCFRKGDTQGLNEATKELNKVNKQISNLRTNAANIQAAMKRIDQASPRDLQRTLKMINNELNSGRVPRGSKEWNEYCEQLKKVKRELSEVNKEMSDQGSVFDNLKDKFNDWGAAAAAGVAAFAGVVMSGKAAVQAYADMEAEEANVRKFTGMTADEVKKLNEEFKKIDTRTSREELNQLAQEAGRLGKQSIEDVLGFVKAANQINVALDDLGEGATLTLSKLTDIFGDEGRLGTERSLLAVGSVINELSQNCSASAPYLAEFSQRMAGVGAQAKMTIPQIMAFAAVLDSQGQNLEASATALSQLIMKLYQDPAKFAKAAGLEVKSFTELLKKDANEAVLVLLDTLNKMGGMEKLAPIFEEMGTDGARASAVMAALAGNIDTVRKQQNEANIAFNEATSVTKEYEVQNNTVQAGLDKAKKRFNELAVTLGEKLLPVMRYAISGSSMILRVLSVLVNFLIEYKTVVLSAAAAVATYTVALKANSIAIALNNGVMQIANGLYRLGTPLVLACKVAYFALTGQTIAAARAQIMLNNAMKVNPIALVLSGLVAATVAMYNYSKSTAKAREEEMKAAQEAEAFSKSLRTLSSETIRKAQQEVDKLTALYKTATNELKSREERLEAVRQLKKEYPDYFKKLDNEIILAGKAKTQYDELRKSIVETARARAAEDLIKNNESLWIEKDQEAEKLRAKIAANEKEIWKQEKIKKQNSGTTKGQTWANSKGSAAMQALNSLRASNAELYKQLGEIEAQQQDIEAASKEISEKYGVSSSISTNISTDKTIIPTNTIGETEKERKEREKREREAKKQIKEQLDQQKAIRDREEAANIANRSTGKIDYLEYIKEKEQIDLRYVENRKKVYEKAGQTESDEYAALLKEEEELKAKSIDRQNAATLRDLEAGHKKELDNYAKMFFDPNSSMFQNQKAYNLALLNEDVLYLKEKLKLYTAGSEEWERTKAQLDERLAKDQLDRQKETAQAYMEYSKEYHNLDRQTRLAHEEAILNRLHQMGLLKEDEYQKALQTIRRKYRGEETAENKAEIEKRHADIDEDFKETKELMSYSTDVFGKSLVDMACSWEKMMSDMKNNGEGFWTSFAQFSQSALSFVSAALSQFSAYSNAQRDLDIAKIEKRYDKEIKAAGKNSKKAEALEKKKQEEIAATKKKYNDRAMKIEIAQAIAQSAINAMLGYQAGLKFPAPANTWMPAVLAGLAVAQGAMQIAIIKKQHEAQAAGYYEGGFTGGNKYKKEAGVVHEGEFVANHNAVNNPQLSGLFRLLDYAQRNNTVGSLTAEDVSNALGQGQGVSARGEVATVNPTIVTNTVDTSSLDRLSETLDRGIEAVVILDGERGLHRKYEHFKKLINNPKRND